MACLSYQIYQTFKVFHKFSGTVYPYQTPVLFAKRVEVAAGLGLEQRSEGRTEFGNLSGVRGENDGSLQACTYRTARKGRGQNPPRPADQQ